ncbi:MAG: hypothetical protein Q7T76_08435 [Ferruginibacter sp.]|nr:hypothetical protein [Ferruginibacter sp.]
MQKTFVLWFVAILIPGLMFGQTVTPIFYKGAIKEKRISLQKNLVQQTIIKGLSMPLGEVTEDYWIDAFGAMELLRYQSPWTDGRVHLAFDSIAGRSPYFQRSLMELAYANYDERLSDKVTRLMNSTTELKTYAMCVEFLLRNNPKRLPLIKEDEVKRRLVKNQKDEAIAHELFRRLKTSGNSPRPSLEDILDPEFLKNHRVLFSFQRKDRNYPGIALVRDSTGRFVTEVGGQVIAVAQLARSISNLPGYLTNGNTPQGIFRMYGLDTSKSNFIGPTSNIQLTMPFETSLKHFMADTTITDTTWTEKWYKKLLTGNLKKYPAFYESFYAGQAGRTEIIAHGTTVDPEFYKSQPYYPQTPTMGCLCTIETWSEADGKRLYSDQERLVAALLKTGGVHGYCVVVELDAEERPVTLQDVLPWIKKMNQ